MKKTHVLLLVIGSMWLFSACKSEFERIRVSGNPQLVLRKAFEYYDKAEYQRSQTLFDLVLNTIRGDTIAERAYFYYAYTYYYQKQYTLAAYYFKNFSNTFTTSAFREEAAYMSAYSNYLLSPTYRLDQGSSRTAIDEFQLFTNLFPKSKRVEECNKLIDELRRKLEEKAFAEGELYYNLRQYQSAVISFDNLLRDYPESPDAERVRFLIAKSSFLLSENSVIEKKLERYAECVTRCNDFLDKYSTGKYTKEIKQLRRDAEDAQKALRKRLKTT